MAEIRVGEYLFRRLKQLGIDTVFGVPGDYELLLLDSVKPAGIKWIGTPNELVGAYAADGYARLKGAAALVTTFGPGELSALCGLGGSFCELVPVLHIVGYPSFAAQASGQILHHTLGDKSYDHYNRMSSELSCATTILKIPGNATAEIDRVLNEMMYHSQPGYIGISEDVVKTMVPLSSSEGSSIKTGLSPGLEDDKAVAAITSELEKAANPIVIVDGGAARGSWASYASDLITSLKVPHFNTVMGKGVIGEYDPLFGGCYTGAGSWPQTAKAVEDSDCILWLGNMPSDFNTGMFSEEVKTSTVIDLQRFEIMVGEKKFQARISHVLPKLTKAIQASSILAQRAPSMPPVKSLPEPTGEIPPQIEQDWLWPRLKSFIKPGDMVIAETGTAQFGIDSTRFPDGVYYWTQAVWGSIGYAIGAAVGSAVAGKELGKYRRMLVFTGEGSLQLTVQALSILNRHGVVPYVFILNNNGYTVERYFNGWNSDYNDVPMWDYGGLFKAFAPGIPTNTFKTETAAELDKLLADESFQNATNPQCIDMVMDTHDAPFGMRAVFENKKKLAEK